MEQAFIQASKNKLRFQTSKGMLSTEDLWDLPLQSNTGKVNLDDIAIELQARVEANQTKTVSFVNKNAKKEDDGSELALKIVTYIIEVKLAENEARNSAQKKAADRQEIMRLIQEKKSEQLSSASLEDLEARLAALSA